MDANRSVHLAGMIWIIFGLYWLVSARKLKAVKQHEPYGERIVQIVWMTTAYMLLFNDELGRGWWGRRFLPDLTLVSLAGVALTGAGVVMAIWARGHLGENWSAMVTLKEGHELIRSGPYRRIRHPIYTGMLLGLLGTAVALGEDRGLIAFGIALVNYYLKAKKEERFLFEEFADKFSEHTQHTGMFLPKRS